MTVAIGAEAAGSRGGRFETIRQTGWWSVAVAVLRRVPWVVVTVWGVSTIVFFLARIAGNPVSLLVPPEATPEQVKVTTHNLGLDASTWEQYRRFLAHAVRGDFGDSFTYQQSALGLVWDRVGATFELALSAILISILLAVPLGLVAAFRPRSIAARVGSAFATLCQSIPVFWLAPMLVLLFAVKVHIFPSSGKAGLSSWVLPAVSLALFQTGLYFRVVRATGIDFLMHDASRLVRSKGASHTRLALQHLMPNICAPLLTVIGLDLARLLGGSVIVETVFAWPGIGQLLIQAAQSHDYPVIQALVVVFAAGVVIVNMGVEAIREAIDPRSRSQA